MPKFSIKQLSEKSFETKMDLIRAIKKDYDNILRFKALEYKNNANKIIEKQTINYQLMEDFKIEMEEIKGDKILIKTIANSTNVIDSHLDLHLFSTWDKNVLENKTTLQLQEHVNRFSNLLNKKAKNYNEVRKFSDFGINSNMEFKANISEFVLEHKDNPFMFDNYVQGKVTQHSVGMMYVWGKMELAYYDEDSEKNMDFFEKAKSQAINPEIADENGYVWVISEAIKRENSSVLMGSNPLTPTLSIKNYEPLKDTQKHEPPQSTQKTEFELFLKTILKN
jgi:hypothetical protein